MAISGGNKFFEKNFADIDYGDTVTVAVSTGGASGYRLRERRPDTKWQSVGSDDITQESIEIDFGSEKDLDRLLFIGHNWKGFTVKWWDGNSWEHFSNVVTKEGTQSNITETTHTKDNSYYEFTQVQTEKIQVLIDTTQTVDAEKFIHELIATRELGTFAGYPVCQMFYKKHQTENETLSGKPRTSVHGESFSGTLSFGHYPTVADHALILALWESNREFLFWRCGGDESQFRFPMQGNRLEDIYLVWFTPDFNPNYVENVYSLGLGYELGLREVA